MFVRQRLTSSASRRAAALMVTSRHAGGVSVRRSVAASTAVSSLASTTMRHAHNHARSTLSTTTALVSGASSYTRPLAAVLGLAAACVAAQREEGVVHAASVDATNYDNAAKIFSQHADTFNANGERCMSPKKFIQVMLHTDESTAEALSKTMIRFMGAEVDKDGDGLIEFDEFYAYMSLLANDEKAMELKFKAFDIDGNGRIDRNEFEQVVTATQGSKAMEWYESHGLLDKFFKGGKTMKLDDYRQFMRDLQNELVRLEFRTVDVNGQGYITGRQFVSLFHQQHRSEETAHSYLSNNATLARFADAQGRVSEDTYVAFINMLQDLDKIERAIKLACVGTPGLNKAQFRAAVQKIARIDTLSDAEVDAVFALFDTDGDGVLTFSEFKQVMRMGKSPLRRFARHHSWSEADHSRSEQLHQQSLVAAVRTHKGLASALDD